MGRLCRVETRTTTLRGPFGSGFSDVKNGTAFSFEPFFVTSGLARPIAMLIPSASSPPPPSRLLSSPSQNQTRLVHPLGRPLPTGRFPTPHVISTCPALSYDGILKSIDPLHPAVQLASPALF